MELTMPLQSRAPPSLAKAQPLTTRKEAGWPMMASRSMLGLSERAQMDTVNMPETVSCTEKRRTESELSPQPNVSSKIGISLIPRRVSYCDLGLGVKAVVCSSRGIVRAVAFLEIMRASG